ncbi:MAG: hypothetical protein LBU89_09920 [Fibromonadaceae bacterium]|nr:hypothetical protein [Fibromonadaceae bacterium]
MNKTKSIFAIVICSMMMFPSHANAFWLDVIKEFVNNSIKTIVMPKSAKGITVAAENKSAGQVAKSGAQRTPEDIYDALNRIGSICMEEFVRYVPCAVGTEKSFDRGMASKKAADRARVELAKNMGTYVEANAEFDEKSEEDEAGVLKEAMVYIADAKLSTNQLVSGAQQYLSYTYIDEEATQINKGRTVYVTTVVMVLNRELLGKALEDAAKEKSLSEQIIKESKQGVVTIVKNALKKMKK